MKTSLPDDDIQSSRGDPGTTQRLVRRYLPALGLFVAGLVVWEVMVTVLGIEGFILPKPSVIAATFIAEFPGILAAGLFTLREALGGFVIGSALGIVAALATARWVTVRVGLLPFAVAASAAPIIALAPITNQWFGITNPLSKMAVVAVIVFFPVLVNMGRGLIEIDSAEIELVRSVAGSERDVLWKVRFPNSLPYLFGAFKVGATLSVIAAIVTEYFGGSRQALGVYISQQAALFHFAEAWAAIIIGSLLGLAFYGVILLAERLVMPWHVSMRAVAER